MQLNLTTDALELIHELLTERRATLADGLHDDPGAVWQVQQLCVIIVQIESVIKYRKEVAGEPVHQFVS